MVIKLNEIQVFKRKALIWASSFDVACYLDSNDHIDPYTKFDTLIAIGTKAEVIAETGGAFDKLEEFRSNNPGWINGFFSYDLKNELESLSSNNPDYLQFPELYFFSPQHLIIINSDKAEIISDTPEAVVAFIEQQTDYITFTKPGINLSARFSKAEYIKTVKHIQQHINRGDIYITNFCQEFFAANAEIDPLSIFLQLTIQSPTPFSSYFKWHQHYIIGASPERFLAKRGNTLISQPIKGTAKRSADPVADKLARHELRTNPKELQENVMIVDLVRNDLTRSAKQGSVITDDLFGIYSFRHIHQMRSTVICELEKGVSIIQAIKNTFPMGSMTGAPKVSAMQLMEQFERGKRGVYAGAVGYFDPNNDFDFNVVIRSLLYNADYKYLSFHAGSAITYHADAEKEYEECLLKAKAILEVLGRT